MANKMHDYRNSEWCSEKKTIKSLLLSLLLRESFLSLAPGLAGPKLCIGIDKANKSVKQNMGLNLEQEG